MGHISQIDSCSDTITLANDEVDGGLGLRIWDLGFGIWDLPDGPILELAPATRGELMRSHWTIAALLSSALIAGCNGRNNDNAQNSQPNEAAAPANAPAAGDQTVAPAPPAQSQQPYTTADNSAVSTQRPAAAPRATTGRRDTVTPRTTTPSRNETYTAPGAAPPQVRLPARENNRVAETAAPVPRAPQWREVTIPAGTAFPLEMTSALSSESAQVEAPVSAKLRNAIVINGDTAIPAGAVVSGTVT